MRMVRYLQILQASAVGILFAITLIFASTYVIEKSSGHQTSATLAISALRYSEHHQPDNYVTVTDYDVSKYPRLKEALDDADLNYKMSSVFGRGAKSLLYVNSPHVVQVDELDGMAIANGLGFAVDEQSKIIQLT